MWFTQEKIELDSVHTLYATGVHFFSTYHFFIVICVSIKNI